MEKKEKGKAGSPKKSKMKDKLLRIHEDQEALLKRFKGKYKRGTLSESFIICEGLDMFLEQEIPKLPEVVQEEIRNGT